MAPVASSSTAQLPGFRSSRPRRTAATLAQSKTRANLLVQPFQPDRKGKGKARDLPDDYNAHEDEEYAPGRGQLQRRKRRVRPDRGQKRVRELSAEEEEEGRLPVDPPGAATDKLNTALLERIEAKRARKRARKDEQRAEQLAQVRAREALEAAQGPNSSKPEPPWTSLQGQGQGRAKKRVQFEAPASDSDGRIIESAAEEEQEDDDDGGDEGLMTDFSLQGIDLTDPTLLPAAERRRGRRFWRALEYGGYSAALHDVARNEADLGRALVQWEALRKAREAEERHEVDMVEAARAEEGARGPSAELGTQRRRTTSVWRRFNPHRSLLPTPLDLTEDDLETDHVRLRRKFDEDGHEILPLPTSLALARMARWPQHASLLPDSDPPATSTGLEDTLLASYERAQRTTQVDLMLPHLPVTGARSAYSADGPLAYLGDGSSDSTDHDTEVDEEGTGPDPLSGVPLPLDWSDAPPALAAVPPLLSSILLRLTDCIPKSPLPALDLRYAQKRADQIAKDDRKRGVDRDANAPEWEEVVAIARERGVPEQIVTTLEERMITLFGPSRRAPVILPREGNPTVLRLKTSKRLRKHSEATANWRKRMAIDVRSTRSGDSSTSDSRQADVDGSSEGEASEEPIPDAQAG